MPDDPNWRYPGFRSPNYTQVPDELFDAIAPRLTEAELRVLLYVVRRTFGFKKTSDAISVNQMVGGVVTRDGRRLDHGTGLSRSAVWRGANGLVKKGLLTVNRVKNEDGEYETNIYALRFADEEAVSSGETGVSLQKRYPAAGVSLPENNPLSPREQPVALQESIQETGQETERQETEHSNDSKDPGLVMSKAEAEQIAWHIADLAREFADRAPAKSSATRACRLYLASGLSLEAFLDAVQAARLRTKRHAAAIKAKPVADGRAIPLKPKMAYFFAVLEDLVQRGEASAD